MNISRCTASVDARFISRVLAVVVVLASVCPALIAEESRPYAVGQKVVNFVLPDAQGNQVALSDFNDKTTVVLYSMGTGCPISNLYLNELHQMQKQFADKSFQIIGINSNAGVTPKELAGHASEFKVTFPVLLDEDQSVANMLGIERTAEVLLLDNHRMVRYHGRIDDRFGYRHKNAKPTRRDLLEAIQELASGRAISVATTVPAGCLITDERDSEPEAEITYAKHVSRIIQDRCQACHRPGSIGPFALMDYDDARNWTEMIREVALQRRMPPWHADPRYGKFSTDRSLTNEQLSTLVSWIDAGAPFGDEKDLPAEREYYKNWQIGKPDIIFRLPDVQTVPADGVIPYLRFVIPTNFTEDVWYSAAELLPDNAAVVHHIQASCYVPEEGEDLDLSSQSQAAESTSRDDQNATAQRRRRGTLVSSFAPGEEPFEFPEGVAGRIPAGAVLRITMHYTPTGKVEKDRSMLGIKLYKGTPQREAHTAAAFKRGLKIPPYNPNFMVESDYTIEQDVLMLSLHPHMHLRGKDMMYTANYPDGTSELLLSVPQYDFNWQNTYEFEKPKPMPAGTKIHVVGHFDNSPQNPANPDPSKTITFGPQTWDEMFIGYFNYTTAATLDELEAAKTSAAGQ
jgi:peroxiredoxin